MKHFIFTLLLTILLTGCGSLNLQKHCYPVVDHQEYFMCSKLGFFE